MIRRRISQSDVGAQAGGAKMSTELSFEARAREERHYCIFAAGSSQASRRSAVRVFFT